MVVIRTQWNENYKSRGHEAWVLTALPVSLHIGSNIL